MRRLCLFSLLLVIVLCTAAQAITLTELNEPDIPESGSAGSLELVAGPYLQNMTTEGVTIAWQTSLPAAAVLTVYEGYASHSCRTSAGRLGMVRVSGLKSAESYSCRLSVVGQDGVSSVADKRFAFTTFPRDRMPVKFIAYGDSRSLTERHSMVMDAMAGESDCDFVLHTGDIVSSGNLSEWVPEFFEPARAIVRRVPFFPAVGNHENNSPFYFRYFDLPMEERWYSFDVSGVHVIVLDSCTSFDAGSEQYRWLVSDLEKNKAAPWKFVVLHHPIYTSGWHGALGEDGLPKETAVRVAQQLLPQLAARYGIAAFISGHDHHYERAFVNGVHYLITGGGGAPGPRDREAEARENDFGGLMIPVLHYTLFTVGEDKAVVKAVDIDGKALDTFEILQPAKR